MKKKPSMEAAYIKYCTEQFGDFQDARQEFFEVVQAYGFDGTLEGLKFPTDRKAIWFNGLTGHEESLQALLDGRHELMTELEELGYILEDWLPKEGDLHLILLGPDAEVPQPKRQATLF
jgi:hypothetical protein